MKRVNCDIDLEERDLGRKEVEKYIKIETDRKKEIVKNRIW